MIKYKKVVRFYVNLSFIYEEILKVFERWCQIMVITKEEFDIKFEHYFKLMYKIAYGYTLNSNDAEDVVQESFYKFYRAHKTFDDEEQEKYYLIRIVINQSLDFIKKNKKVLLLGDEYIENLPDNVESEKSFEEVSEGIYLLKDDFKNIIILYYYEKYNIKEISQILKISENAASTRLSRARAKLKEIIEERRVQNEKR